MSSSLMKTSKTMLETSSTREKVGMNMVKVGSGGLALYGVAALLPFVSLFPLLIIMIVAGFFI